jgi:hypothetical protein
MNDPDLNVGSTEALTLRVSAATVCKVIFAHPEYGRKMLALERMGTLAETGTGQFPGVIAKPFGGGIQLRDPEALRPITGEFHFDSRRSRNERDFRILIEPSRWPAVREFCLEAIQSPRDDVLETSPDRELLEEFEEALKIQLTAEQYRVKPSGVVIEDKAKSTHNLRARGQPTVRVYQVFEVEIVDPGLVQAILQNSQMISDQDLAERARIDAQLGGRGRSNAVLALPLPNLIRGYQDMDQDALDEPVCWQGHWLDGNVLAVLEEIETRRYQRYRF